MRLGINFVTNLAYICDIFKQIKLIKMTKEELDQVESSQRQWFDTLQHQEKMNVAVEQSEYNKFAMLKPKVSIDGNQYCILYGEDLQSGIAGFGDTIYLAILDFNKSFYTPIKKN